MCSPLNCAGPELLPDQRHRAPRVRGGGFGVPDRRGDMAALRHVRAAGGAPRRGQGHFWALPAVVPQCGAVGPVPAVSVGCGSVGGGRGPPAVVPQHGAVGPVPAVSLCGVWVSGWRAKDCPLFCPGVELGG
eukprot:352782-Chlamydomonas_euryale.AAC.1